MVFQLKYEYKFKLLNQVCLFNQILTNKAVKKWNLFLILCLKKTEENLGIFQVEGNLNLK